MTVLDIDMSITDKIFFPCVIIWKKLGQRPFDSFLQKVCPWLISVVEKNDFPNGNGGKETQGHSANTRSFQTLERGSKGWFYRLVTVSWKQIWGFSPASATPGKLSAKASKVTRIDLFFSREFDLKISLSCKSVPTWNNHHQTVFFYHQSACRWIIIGWCALMFIWHWSKLCIRTYSKLYGELLNNILRQDIRCHINFVMNQAQS